jgi:hypothetical protein
MNNNRLMSELAKRELARRSIMGFTQRQMPGYQAGWFHTHLATILDNFITAVEEKKSPRLIIACPPRTGKSTLVSRMLPAYALGHRPDWEFVCATYAQDLADRFGREVREVLNDSAFLDLFPNLKLDVRSNSVDFVRTTANGSYKAVGVGGSLTGAGAHILSVDDPLKGRAEADSETYREALWDWYSAVARTRLHPGGGVIVTATRWHPGDLTGRLIQQMQDNKDADQWLVYSFPAIAEEDEPHRKKGEALHPDRYPIHELEKIKNSLTERDWAALYQCRPYVDGGAFFRREHVKYYDPDQLNVDIHWLVCADYATSTKATSDHTFIGALGLDHTGHVYLHKTIHYGRFSPAESVKKTVALAKLVGAHTFATEKGAIANLLESALRDEMKAQKWFLSTALFARTAAKHIHAITVQSRMELGKFSFPDIPIVRDTLIPLFLAFTPGADGEDDAIDGITNGCIAIDKSVIKPSPPPLPKIEEDVDPWDAIERRNSLGAGKSDGPAFARLNGDPLKLSKD